MARSTGLAALAMLALGCGGSAPKPKQPDPPLAERAFVLRSNEGAALLEGADVLLHFNAGSLSLQADCNHMGGEFLLEQGRLVMDGMYQTEMGCDAERHAQDEWLQKFFTSRPTLALEGQTLTLRSESASLVFLDREVADPDRPLIGTTWEAGNYIDGETAMGLMGIEGPRLTFNPDGTFRARSVCLTIDGRYAVAGERLTLSESQASQGDCRENDKVAAEFVRSVLADGELSHSINARTLTLKTSGTRWIEAHAVEAPVR